MNIKKLFPLLNHYPELIYCDNAATSQMPQAVLDQLHHFYTVLNAPINRSAYALAEAATESYHIARKRIAHEIDASPEEVIFVSGATEGINFIVDTWGNEHIHAGDEIVLTELEHHSNLLAWQRLAEKKGAYLKFIPVDNQGALLYDSLETIITKKTKIVSCLDTSNALGCMVDIGRIHSRAQEVGAVFFVDACQSLPHKKISVKEYGTDFLVFSGHKMCGPTGIGILYIKRSIQKHVPPYQVGGGMVYEADYGKTVYAQAPFCYEAGTPFAAQAYALARACDFLVEYKKDNSLFAYISLLSRTLLDGLLTLPEIHVLGPVESMYQQGTSIVSFIHKRHHAHDIAAYLDKKNICVRAGHFCAQPLAKKLRIDSALRISFYLYNTMDDVHAILAALKELS